MPVNAQLGNMQLRAICALVGGSAWPPLGCGRPARWALSSAFLPADQAASTSPSARCPCRLNAVIMALAGAERIFELMDEPSPRPMRAMSPWSTPGTTRTTTSMEAQRAHRASGPGSIPTSDGTVTYTQAGRRRDASTTWTSAIRREQDRPARHQPLCRAGPEDRLRRLHRRGQDHHHQPHQPLLRHRRTARSATTASTSTKSRRPTCAAPWASCCRIPTCSPARSWRTSATAVWTPPTRSASPPPSWPTPTASSRRLPEGYDTMLTGDGANLSPGPAPAAGHRPRSRGRPAGADPGRGHLLHRHPHRGSWCSAAWTA